jgi:hypothetical protein
LLALGPKAQVQFDHTVNQEKDGGKDFVSQAYDVTYEEDGEKKSFLVTVKMLRSKLPSGQSGWQIVQAERGH